MTSASVSPVPPAATSSLEVASPAMSTSSRLPVSPQEQQENPMSSDNQYTALGPAAVGFQTDGANIVKGAMRVTFWSALAMAVTALVGMLVGTLA